ncbi:ASIC2 protein, partial [Amia calva]|nr:ASIC2 protein [Amia calva]
MAAVFRRKTFTLPDCHSFFSKANSKEIPHGTRLTSLEEFANSSSLHGLSQVATPGPFTGKRCMWIVAFIVCLSILIYHQVGVVSTYFTYPHVTKLEEITDGDKVFPAITFCNTNSVRFSQLQTCDFKALGFTESDLDFSILDEEDVKRLTALFSVEKIKYCRYCNYNWTEFYERTGPDLSSMMIHCTFENLKCKMEDFRVVSNICIIITIMENFI